jgi:hypothetical protein
MAAPIADFMARCKAFGVSSGSVQWPLMAALSGAAPSALSREQSPQAAVVGQFEL